MTHRRALAPLALLTLCLLARPAAATGAAGFTWGGGLRATDDLEIFDGQADSTAQFTVAASSGNTVVGGTLGVTGAVALTAGLTVGTTLTVTGALECDSTLGVDGNARFGAAGTSKATIAAATGAIESAASITAGTGLAATTGNVDAVAGSVTADVSVDVDAYAYTGDAAFSCAPSASAAATAVDGLLVTLDNSGGTARSGSLIAGVRVPVTTHATDAGSAPYAAFVADACTDSGGTSLTRGFWVGAGYDVGVEIDSGGLKVDAGGIDVNAGAVDLASGGITTAGTIEGVTQPAASANWVGYAPSTAMAILDCTGGTGCTSGATKAFGPTFPDNTLAAQCMIQVNTTFTSAADTATIEIGFPTDDVDCIDAAIAINDGTNPWDASSGVARLADAPGAGISCAQLTAARQLQAVFAVQDVTAGVLRVYCQYFVGP